MTDNEIVKAYEGLTPSQKLNLFRNLYYNEGSSTERGIIANAINDFLPRYQSQKAEIERLNAELDNKQFRCDSCDRIGLTRGEYMICIKRVKNEAIEKFVVKLLDKYDVWTESDAVEYRYVSELCDNLVKEFKGEVT